MKPGGSLGKTSVLTVESPEFKSIECNKYLGKINYTFSRKIEIPGILFCSLFPVPCSLPKMCNLFCTTTYKEFAADAQRDGKNPAAEEFLKYDPVAGDHDSGISPGTPFE
jgi:hypothetical protein